MQQQKQKQTPDGQEPQLERPYQTGTPKEDAEQSPFKSSQFKGMTKHVRQILQRNQANTVGAKAWTGGLGLAQGAEEASPKRDLISVDEHVWQGLQGDGAQAQEHGPQYDQRIDSLEGQGQATVPKPSDDKGQQDKVNPFVDSQHFWPQPASKQRAPTANTSTSLA